MATRLVHDKPKCFLVCDRSRRNLAQKANVERRMYVNINVYATA
jgi:hypothetical protein